MATHQLTKVANSMAGTWDGPPAMLPMFKKMFGSFTASYIIKQNDFADLQKYFLQKVINSVLYSRVCTRVLPRKERNNIR